MLNLNTVGDNLVCVCDITVFKKTESMRANGGGAGHSRVFAIDALVLLLVLSVVTCI